MLAAPYSWRAYRIPLAASQSCIACRSSREAPQSATEGTQILFKRGWRVRKLIQPVPDRIVDPALRADRSIGSPRCRSVIGGEAPEASQPVLLLAQPAV